MGLRATERQREGQGKDPQGWARSPEAGQPTPLTPGDRAQLSAPTPVNPSGTLPFGCHPGFLFLSLPAALGLARQGEGPGAEPVGVVSEPWTAGWRPWAPDLPGLHLSTVTWLSTTSQTPGQRLAGSWAL